MEPPVHEWFYDEKRDGQWLQPLLLPASMYILVISVMLTPLVLLLLLLHLLPPTLYPQPVPCIHSHLLYCTSLSQCCLVSLLLSPMPQAPGGNYDRPQFHRHSGLTTCVTTIARLLSYISHHQDRSFRGVIHNFQPSGGLLEGTMLHHHADHPQRTWQAWLWPLLLLPQLDRVADVLRRVGRSCQGSSFAAALEMLCQGLWMYQSRTINLCYVFILYGYCIMTYGNQVGSVK